MIAGIILVSMFTAQVSSRLTAQELKTEDHVFGKKVSIFLVRKFCGEGLAISQPPGEEILSLLV